MELCQGISFLQKDAPPHLFFPQRNTTKSNATLFIWKNHVCFTLWSFRNSLRRLNNKKIQLQFFFKNC